MGVTEDRGQDVWRIKDLHWYVYTSYPCDSMNAFIDELFSVSDFSLPPKVSICVCFM